jgi:hypothetical protein
MENGEFKNLVFSHSSLSIIQFSITRIWAFEKVSCSKCKKILPLQRPGRIFLQD